MNKYIYIFGFGVSRVWLLRKLRKIVKSGLAVICFSFKNLNLQYR